MEFIQKNPHYLSQIDRNCLWDMRLSLSQKTAIEMVWAEKSSLDEKTSFPKTFMYTLFWESIISGPVMLIWALVTISLFCIQYTQLATGSSVLFYITVLSLFIMVNVIGVLRAILTDYIVSLARDNSVSILYRLVILWVFSPLKFWDMCTSTMFLIASTMLVSMSIKDTSNHMHLNLDTLCILASVFVYALTLTFKRLARRKVLLYINYKVAQKNYK